MSLYTIYIHMCRYHYIYVIAHAAWLCELKKISTHKNKQEWQVSCLLYMRRVMFAENWSIASTRAIVIHKRIYLYEFWLCPANKIYIICKESVVLLRWSQNHNVIYMMMMMMIMMRFSTIDMNVCVACIYVEI